MEEVLAACDVFIMPTKYEAASLAVLEAAAAGLAVITTDVAMAAEVFGWQPGDDWAQPQLLMRYEVRS